MAGAPGVRIDRLEAMSLAPGRWVLEPMSADEDWFDLLHVVAGSAVREGAPAPLSAGQLMVTTESRRSRVDVHEGGRAILVRIPSIAAGPHATALRAVAGRPLGVEHGTSGIVTYVLQGIIAEGGPGTEYPVLLAEHVVGMVALMCLDVLRSEAVRSTMLSNAMEYIETHLGEVELTPNRVAAAQYVSTRTLNRLFELEDTTVSAWVRMRRLERCRSDLADPTHRGVAVSHIGARWGLWEAAHFSRLFKASFGASPRAYRQAALADAELQPALRASA